MKHKSRHCIGLLRIMGSLWDISGQRESWQKCPHVQQLWIPYWAQQTLILARGDHSSNVTGAGRSLGHSICLFPCFFFFLKNLFWQDKKNIPIFIFFWNWEETESNYIEGIIKVLLVWPHIFMEICSSANQISHSGTHHTPVTLKKNISIRCAD